MNGTWLLAGTLTGFTLAIIWGYHQARHIYWTQYQREFETRIPSWVNQGNRAVIGDYDEILEAIRTETHFALWEHELEQVDE